MKKAILTVIAAGLTASAAMATNIDLSVQQTNGTNAISVAPGATVDYKIVGTLTDGVNEGLALIGLSLHFTGGPLNPANTPLDGDFTCANPMRNFVKMEGMTNPDGYDGTVIGGDLIQAGGAQNTINNTVGNALFPIGAVLVGVAKPLAEGGCGPAVLLTGSLSVPPNLAPGPYVLRIIQDGINDPFANVIIDGEDGTVFWATEAAGIGTVTNLTINVTQVCDVARWDSVNTHTRSGQTDLVVPLEISNDGLFTEPRSGLKKVVVSFNGTINAATATAGNVVVCGLKRGVTPDTYVPVDLNGVGVTAAAVAGDTKMEIIFEPRLPDFARYTIALGGVECSGGGAAQAGTGGLSRVLFAIQGDMTNDRRVNSTDVGGCRTQIPRDPIDPAILTEVRGDVNNDKRINSTDVGFARTLVGNDARTIPDPVCP